MPGIVDKEGSNGALGCVLQVLYSSSLFRSVISCSRDSPFIDVIRRVFLALSRDKIVDARPLREFLKKACSKGIEECPIFFMKEILNRCYDSQDDGAKDVLVNIFGLTKRSVNSSHPVWVFSGTDVSKAERTPSVVVSDSLKSNVLTIKKVLKDKRTVELQKNLVAIIYVHKGRYLSKISAYGHINKYDGTHVFVKQQTLSTAHSVLCFYSSSSVQPSLDRSEGDSINVRNVTYDPLKAGVKALIRQFELTIGKALMKTNNFFAVRLSNPNATCGICATNQLLLLLDNNDIEALLKYEKRGLLKASVGAMMVDSRDESITLDHVVEPFPGTVEALYLHNLVEGREEAKDKDARRIEVEEMKKSEWSGASAPRIIDAMFGKKNIDEDLLGQIVLFNDKVRTFVSLQATLAQGVQRGRPVILNIDGMALDILKNTMKEAKGLTAAIVRSRRAVGGTHATLIVRTPNGRLIRFDNGAVDEITEISHHSVTRFNDIVEALGRVLLFKPTKKSQVEESRTVAGIIRDEAIKESSTIDDSHPIPADLDEFEGQVVTFDPEGRLILPILDEVKDEVFTRDSFTNGQRHTFPADTSKKAKIVSGKMKWASDVHDEVVVSVENEELRIAKTNPATGDEFLLCFPIINEEFICPRRVFKGRKMGCPNKTARMGFPFTATEFYKYLNNYHFSCFEQLKK